MQPVVDDLLALVRIEFAFWRIPRKSWKICAIVAQR
jgi:hypothetical protein